MSSIRAVRAGPLLLLPLLLLLLLLLHPCNAFYLPGMSPTEYSEGSPVRLYVNSITSPKTHLPYDYYSLPFCRPLQLRQAAENLGELLTGNELMNSRYELRMMVDDQCRLVCETQLYDAAQVREFVRRIDEGYYVNMVVDNLPAAVDIHSADSDVTYKEYEHGFRIGEAETVMGASERSYTLHNHLSIKILVHSAPDEIRKRVVGFEVEPFSVRHDGLTPDATRGLPSLPADRCSQETLRASLSRPLVIQGPGAAPDADGRVAVTFTYNVAFEPSDTRWASRWDTYLTLNTSGTNDDMHWFSILNSVLIVLFLTGMIAMIMTRTVFRDLRRYNRVPTDDELAEEREEYGWKLVHADVFRAPAAPMALSVLAGTGAQIAGMAFFTLVFAAAGFLSPANRGSLMIALLLLFVLMGVLAGYTSSRVYKFYNGSQWQRCTIATALSMPGFVFGTFFVINLFVWSQGSAGAVPFTSMFSVLTLWFGISVPLVFLGAFYGYRQDAISAPTAVASVPRPVPAQPWYMNPLFTTLVGGILPFGAVFVELFFILSSIWLDQYYYVFGFLFLVFFILFITCVEISVVLCYFQLCSEDYRWAWRSFFTSGSSAFYLFAYSAFYFATKLDITAFIPGLVYFGYMFVISVLFFGMTGSIGFIASLFFTRAIFGSIKVD